MTTQLITIFLWIVAVGAPVLAVYLFFRLFEDKKAADEAAERDCVVLSILVPKQNDKTPLAAEQMFAALHGILKPDDKEDHISFEIASEQNATEFYVHVPKHMKEYVEGQIYAQYPTLEIKEVEDYTEKLPPELDVAATELGLAKEAVYPIKTFQNFEVDPLAGITGVLSKVIGNEKVWVHVLVKPADDSWHKRGLEVVKATKAGLPLTGSIWEDFKKTAKDLGKEIPKAMAQAVSAPSEGKKEDKKEDKKLPGPVEAAMGAIETKIQKLGFETKIRIMVAAESPEAAKSKLMAVVGAYKQFSTINLNGFVVGNIITDKEIVQAFKLRPFGSGGYIFNIEELASIYHFPHVSVETPMMVWAGSKKGEPPANLPIEGNVASEELTAFGLTNFRSYNYKFGIKKKDRRLHSYIIGKTGTGKSTLLQNMIIDDIREGRGLAVVDPHGDLIQHVLGFIPEERIQDVVYFNPADSLFPIGFNFLENVDRDQKGKVAGELMSVFTKIWADVWSDRMKYILQNCILALLEYPGATFLSIMRILTDKEYRKKVIDNSTDPVVREFFMNEYEKWDPKYRTEAIAAIQNKVGQFLSSTTIRNIVGQERSTIDIANIMDTGKILLVDLSIGRIGESSAALLGGLLITKLQLAAMDRVDIPEADRRDFYLYVDEFQNFATESFAVILSEARKYHLCLILANQYVAQLAESVSDAIFGNIGTMISFRVGATDGEKLVKEFEPVFDANDLVNLDNYVIYIKMAIDGVTCPAFSAATLPPRTEHYGFQSQVIELSRRINGRPREQVEQEIINASIADISAMSQGQSAKPVEGEAPQKTESKGEDGAVKEIKTKDGNVWYQVDESGLFKDEVGETQAEESEPEPESHEEVEEDEPKKYDSNHHLITFEEAHEVAKTTFNDDRGTAQQHSHHDAVVVEEGELVDVKKDEEE